MRKHVLLISMPAYGHIIPLLELAKKISLHHQVTFAVSKFRIDEILQRELVSKDALQLFGIPDGYFEDAEKEKRMAVVTFNRMFTMVMAGAEKLLEAIPIGGKKSSPEVTSLTDTVGISHPVDVVVADNLISSALPVLVRRRVPFYLFNTGPSFMTLQYFSINADTPTIADLESDNDAVPFIEMPTAGAEPAPISEMLKKVFLPMHRITPLATGIIGNSVYETESAIVDAIKVHPEMKDITYRCVGPLVPDEKGSTSRMELQEKVKKWLDGKSSVSVIYVSFGTIAIPKPDFIREIIKALLALGKPFIWSLPEQEQFRLPEEILHEIPKQFEQAESQYLILHWAPQKLILQHPSTAVFLSHCGWNSTIESLASGVPVVAWPMFGDQMLNALDLVAKGSGVLIDGTGMTSTKVISAEDIQEAIARTAGFGNSSETNAFRKAAQLWRAKLAEATGPNGSSQRNFMDLMKFDDIKA